MKHSSHCLIELLESRRLLSAAAPSLHTHARSDPASNPTPTAVSVKMVEGLSPTTNPATEKLNSDGHLPQDVQVSWEGTHDDYYWVFYTDTSNYYNPASPGLHVQFRYGSSDLASSGRRRSAVSISMEIPLDQLSGPGISTSESRYDSSGTAGGPNTQIYYFTVVATTTDIAPTFNRKGRVSAGAFAYGREVCPPQFFLISGLGDGDVIYNPLQTPQAPTAQNISCFMDADFGDQTTTFAESDVNIATELQNEIGDNTNFPLIMAGQSFGGGTPVGVAYTLKSMHIPIQYLDLFDPVAQYMTYQDQFKQNLPPGNAVYNNRDPYAGVSSSNGGNGFSLLTLPKREISQADDWFFYTQNEGDTIPTGWISADSETPFNNYQGSAYGLSVDGVGVHISQTHNPTVDAQIQKQLNAVDWGA